MSKQKKAKQTPKPDTEQAPPQQPVSGWPSPASPELIVHRQAKPKAEGTAQKYNLTFLEAIEDLYDSLPASYFQPDPESTARGEIMFNKFMRQCQRREDRIAAGTATPQDLEDARREVLEHEQARAAVMEEMQERKKKEEHLSQFYADLERQVRAEEGLPPLSPRILANHKELPWQEDAPGYIPFTAAVGYAKTEFKLSLGKKPFARLLTSNGPIRYMRRLFKGGRGGRCKVHLEDARDFFAYVKQASKATGGTKSEWDALDVPAAIMDEYMKTRDTIRKEKQTRGECPNSRTIPL